MKKFYLLTSLLLFYCMQMVNAQDYRPFPTNNAMWREAYPSFGKKTGYEEQYQYLITGDSIINKKTYHKLQRTGYKHEYDPFGHEYAPIKEFAGYFRNDTLEKKVWLFDNGFEQLLYDFNLQLEDTISTIFNNTFGFCIITNIDTLSLKDGLHKRYEITTEFGNNFYIIEGIGSTKGLLPRSIEFLDSGLLCFSIDGEIIYNYLWGGYDCQPAYLAIEDYEQNKATLSLFPNPAYSTFQIKGIDNPQNVSISVYNIYGQLVMQEQLLSKDDMIHIENLCKGVYIVNICIQNSIVATCKLITM